MSRFISQTLLGVSRRSRMRKFDELLENAYRPLEMLREQQEIAFMGLIEHAKANVPYYRNLRGIEKIRSLEDISSIPFLTKKAIRENIDDLKAVNIAADRFAPNSTGGSTGEKLEFFSDRDQMLAALTLRSNSWTGWRIGDKQIQLWGAHYDISRARSFINRLKTSLVQRNILLSSYDMTEEDMYRYHTTINRYRPELITGYPSALSLLADFIRERRLSIYRPKGIVTSAETLFEHQRKAIESVFGCKVFNRYGSREAGNMAQECGEQSGLHIFSEHVILEIVDENGAPCETGTTGEIVVTVLDNHAFPFIRYRIGDMGAFSNRACPCGRTLPMLERVEGRAFDIIVGVNGNHLPGTYWTILLREFARGISSFQVLQEEYGKILLRLVVDDRFDEGERAKLVSKIKEKCGEDMIVDIALVDAITLTDSGKHRFVVSKVSPYLGDRD